MMGRTHLLATAILGMWLGWTLAMWFAATRSFRTVDRVLGEPTSELRQALAPLGHEQARTVLRHLASEINRTYFGAYGWAQILLGAILLALLWYEARRATLGVVLAGVMLGLEAPRRPGAYGTPDLHSNGSLKALPDKGDPRRFPEVSDPIQVRLEYRCESHSKRCYLLGVGLDPCCILALFFTLDLLACFLCDFAFLAVVIAVVP